MSRKTSILLYLFLMAATTVHAEVRPVRIAIAGDSTARDYTGMSEKYADLCGWGQVLSRSFAAGKAEILNHGKGGCSSKSFISESRWQKLLEDKPDYVLIQFGHNDNPNKGPERETNPAAVPAKLPASGAGSDPTDWYRNNIRTYIEQSRSIGAVPIIVTPMERRSFTSNGKGVREKNKPYADAAKDIARELGAPVIDLNAYSIQLLNKLGLEGCAFMHAHQNGELDNTHFNETGARIYAEYIAEQLGLVVPDLQQVVALPATRTVDQPRDAAE